MTNFLFTTLPSNDLGLLTRSLPVAHELAERGHRVTFCHPAEAPGKLIAEAGFENLEPDDPLSRLHAGDYDGLMQSGQMEALSGLIENLAASSTAEVRDIDHFSALFGMAAPALVRSNVAVLVDLMERSECEAVVDFWNPLSCMAARIVGLPLVSVIQADMHPQSRGFMWWREPSEDSPTAAPAMNEVLAEHGMDRVSKVADLLVGELTLVVGIPELDPLPPSAEVTYVGSILWQHPDAGEPDWAGELDDDTPVLWVYPGNLRYGPPGMATAFDSDVVLRASIEALADQPVQVVLATGHQTLPPDAPALPANFRHEAYVPGLWMAERSDLLIHHGGYGSCQTGLHTGTPALVIPTYSERESNARRIAEEGAGDYVLVESDASGTEKRVAAAEVRKKTFEMLSTPSYSLHARRLRDRLATYGGASEAARLIDEHVNGALGS